MLIFQSYAQKQESSHEEDERRFGIRMRKPFYEISSVFSEEIQTALPEIEKIFQKKGLSEFISTLTPGTQNAIYAASFAWGYENAVRYVKSAMKLEEVKNAADSEERSKAVMESICSQAQSEKPAEYKESASFVWGFYNEDLKETQAQKAKTERILKSSEKTKEEIELPSSSQAAVSLSIEHDSTTPSLLYCASSLQAEEEQKEQQAIAQKREELARLIEAPQAKLIIQEAKKEGSAEKEEEMEKARQIALQRKEELIEEYQRTEKKIAEAIKVLDKLESDKKEELQRIASMLPRELEAVVLRRGHLLASRKALKAQLVKWLAFSSATRYALKNMPPERLFKLISLSSLFRFGR
ncbi:MAG: hypothetical protein N3G22_00905 [Candidatus Micrarchaeota archaeon]|nr:hypothetical protein [Candidatus Micrarchaeota archaeon]